MNCTNSEESLAHCPGGLAHQVRYSTEIGISTLSSKGAMMAESGLGANVVQSCLKLLLHYGVGAKLPKQFLVNVYLLQQKLTFSQSNFLTE